MNVSSPPRPGVRGLFITATDTGAGKTTLMCRLIPEFERAGLTLCIRKPVESGCRLSNGHLLASDAAALAGASRQAPSPEQVCAYRLRHVCSPARAARLENIQLTIAKLAAACIAEDDDVLLVEGAGGFYSPLACDGLNADLARALSLPLLIVVEDRLGCINHGLLTIEAAKRKRLEIAAIVINQATQTNNADTDNYEELKTLTQLPTLKIGYDKTGDDTAGDVKTLAEHLIERNLRNGTDT